MASALILFYYLSEGSKLHFRFLLAIPDADIFSFDEGSIRQIRYEDTESYQITKMFLDNREYMLKRLLGTFMELALPNKEIRRVYNTEILSWLRGTVDGNVMAGLEKALYLNDGKKLQEFLRKYMITCISCFDGAAEGRTRSGGPWLCADRSGTETFYHGMMLGLAAGMSSRYYIRSNRESGEGRFDLVLEPKVHSLPGVIMEFKATKNDAGLSASADEALKQIEDKHYDTDMKDRGIKEIVKYGIAFAGKNVEIAIG